MRRGLEAGREQGARQKETLLREMSEVLMCEWWNRGHRNKEQKGIMRVLMKEETRHHQARSNAQPTMALSKQCGTLTHLSHKPATDNTG